MSCTTIGDGRGGTHGGFPGQISVGPYFVVVFPGEGTAAPLVKGGTEPGVVKEGGSLQVKAAGGKARALLVRPGEVEYGVLEKPEIA